MNKIICTLKKIGETITDNHLRQKILLILVLILFCFVYVRVFAPPKTQKLPAYDETSVQTAQKISDKTPFEMPIHFEPGETVNFTLYFSKPDYLSADKYSLQIKDNNGTVLFTNTFDAKSLGAEYELGFGLINFPQSGGEYILSITANNIPEETALSIYTRQLNGASVPQASVTYSQGISPNVLSISFWIAVAGCILILFYTKKIHVNILASILVFGVLFALLTPLMDVPDESLHVGKTFLVSDFTLFGGSQTVSNGLVQLTDMGQFKQTIVSSALLGAPIQEGVCQSTMGNAQFFPAYIPSALVVSLFQALHTNILPLFYAGRIINLIVYAILAFFAVRTAPRFKIFFGVVAAAPMALYISASYNPDYLTYGLALLLAAWFTKLYFEKGLTIGYRQIIYFTVICALVSVMKYSLVPLCLLMLFIPSSRFASKKTKAAGCAIAIAVSLVAALALFWMNAVQNAGEASALTGDGVNMMGASVSQQLAFMMESFTTTVSIFLRAFMENAPYYITQLFTFGWLTYNIPNIFIYIYVGFIALVGFIYSKYESKTAPFAETRLGAINKFGVFLVLACGFILINLILYLTWTPVGADFIQGVQGRYLLPLLLFLPFLSSNLSPALEEKDVLKTQMNITFTAQLFIILSLIQTLFEYY